VVNNGPSTAHNAVVSDLLPEGLLLLNASPTPFVLSSHLTWTVDQLAVGGVLTFVYSVRSDSGLAIGTLLWNRAQVSVANDTNLLNNQAQVLSQIFGQADVEVIKSPDKPIVKQGEMLTYTIKVVNHGPSLAEDVDVKELLPQGLAMQSLQTSQGACVDHICQMGAMPVSDTVYITVVTKVDPTLPLGTVLTNTAVAFSDTPDANQGNNKDDADVIVGPVVNLSVSKVADHSEVELNHEVTFTLLVTNTGPSIAHEVLLTDTLPEGLTFRRSSLPCSPNGLLVSCNLGSMSAGQVITIQMATLFNVQTVNGLVRNQVAVSAPNTFEPVLVDNESYAEVKLNSVPTAIDLVDFSANSNEQQVTVAWETVLESGVAGYRVWRGTSEDSGQAGLISNGMIPAHGYGSSYQFADTNVEVDMLYYYWLEEIANAGTTTLHGPQTAGIFSNRVFLPLVSR